MSLKTGELEPRVYVRRVTLTAGAAEQRIELPPFRRIVFASYSTNFTLAFGDGDAFVVTGAASIKLPTPCSVIRIAHNAGTTPNTIELITCADPEFDVQDVGW